jgi:CRP-like cAMP-binding protein
LKVLQENLVLPGSAVLTGIALLVVGFFFGSASVLFLAILGLFVCLGFVIAALWVRSLYVNAIYQRLRAHTLSLSDLELALGRPSAQEVEELKTFIAGDNPELREFAAAALGRLSPESFRRLAPELARSPDARLRRLAFQLSPPGALERALIQAGAEDPDPWVSAAAAVAGSGVKPPWVGSRELLDRLYGSPDAESRGAAVWAASFPGGERGRVAESLADLDPKVRLEAISSFARLKGNVQGVAVALIACLEDGNLDVRRAALRQAIRWSPPAAHAAGYEEALLANLASGDSACRKLAGEAIVLQSPATLERLPDLLSAATEVAVAALEPLFRSGKAELLSKAGAHLEAHLRTSLEAADQAGRLAALARVAGPLAEDHRFAALRVSLEDYQRHVVELALAALRALHEKRGFARVELALRSADPVARSEAVETLINFGPARLVEPLVRLVDPESFEGSPARPLSEEEVERLVGHPDAWVKRAAEAVRGRSPDTMKDLIALKKVPLFATLTLEQLSSIDRLMVTRRYHAGEQIFKWGDHSSELYVILEGEVRIHRDDGPQEVTLARLGPSSVMGEMAPFTDQPRSAGAQAVVATVTRVLRKDRLKAILHEHPEVLLEVIKNLSQRLVVANEQLEAAARSLKEAAEPPAPTRPAGRALAGRSRSR